MTDDSIFYALPLYLHLGLPKTGSTFLQREVFPLLDGIGYYEKPKTDLVEGAFPWSGAFRNFFRLSPAIWDELGRELFEEVFGPKGSNRARPVLVSDENVAVNMSNDKNYLAPRRALDGHSRYEWRDHLVKIRKMALDWGFSSVNVLLSTRRQDHFFASGYAQTSDRRPGASQADFERVVARRISKREDYYLDGIQVDYALLYDLTVEALGEKHMCVLPYELMREDLASFLRHWFEFLQCAEEGEHIIKQVVQKEAQPQNVRSAAADTWALRERTLRNVRTVRPRPGRVFRALGLPEELPLRWPDLAREDVIHLTPTLSRKILSPYEKSNRAFAEHMDMDLSHCGYY